MLLQRRPMHQPDHDDGLTNHSRSGRQSHQGSGCRLATLCEIPHRCRGMDNRDSPSDRRGTLPSDTPHQNAYYELQVEDLLLLVLSVSILLGKQEHRPYHYSTDRVPGYTNSYNNLALAG